MRSTSIGVAYLEMRELGFLSPMSTSSLQSLYTLGENSRKDRQRARGAVCEPWPWRAGA